MIFALAAVFLSLGIKKHPLSLLLTLEIINLIIIMLLIKEGIEIYYVLLFICVGACEGALGLRVIIRIIRSK